MYSSLIGLVCHESDPGFRLSIIIRDFCVYVCVSCRVTDGELSQTLDCMVKSIIGEFLLPERFGLIPRPT